MLRLALTGLRGRRSAFAGAAGALFTAALVVTACGVMLASGIRGTTRTERYAGAPVVVAGKQTLHQRVSKEDSEDVLLPERVRVPSRLAGAPARVPGGRPGGAGGSLAAQGLTPGGAEPGPGGP